MFNLFKKKEKQAVQDETPTRDTIKVNIRFESGSQYQYEVFTDTVRIVLEALKSSVEGQHKGNVISYSIEAQEKHD